MGVTRDTRHSDQGRVGAVGGTNGTQCLAQKKYFTVFDDCDGGRQCLAFPSSKRLGFLNSRSLQALSSPARLLPRRRPASETPPRYGRGDVAHEASASGVRRATERAPC